MAQINKPDLYFNTKLYTGDGSSPRTITGVGFNPDFIWGKRRDDAAGHNLFDTVRGAGSDKNLQSNDSGAEGSGLPATYGYISSFETDGFSVTAGSTDNAYWNNNTATYVAWNWLAGGTASSNTDGSITSNVSANTTSGFSIVSYTGTGSNATVGHGLGVTPSMLIVKNRDDSSGLWSVYHHKNTSAPETDVIFLNSINATADSNVYWNDTAPTSSVFSVGTTLHTNNSGQNIIAYCFAEKKGFSKFGSYTGNGSTDGTFVYTGFKPAFVMAKRTDSTGNWYINDTKRDPYNRMSHTLFPNLSSAETSTGWFVDYVSNGFKIRDTGSVNQSGGTFIYMAFAENPLVGTNNIPATAR